MNDNKELLELRAEKFVYAGGGLCKSKGRIIFVPHLFPGELAMVKIIGRRRGILRGRVVKLIEPSSDRVEPICPISGECGGCALMELGIEKQLEYKSKMLDESFSRLGGIDISSVYEGIIPSPKTEHYRNKMEFTFGADGLLGLHKAGSIDELVAMQNCKLASAGINMALKAISEYVSANRLPIYNPKTQQGNLRYATIRSSESDNTVMVNITAREHLAEELFDYVKESGVNITSGWITLNPNPIHSAQGTPFHIYGEKIIREKLAGVNVRVSPFSFIQTNSLGSGVLYNIVKDFLKPKADELVADLYCGVGVIGLFLAPYLRQVVGVENIAQAVEDARLNAKENGIENIRFETEKVRKWPYLAINEGMKIQAMVLDPPRAGLTEKVIERLKLLAPQRIVYVSCNPTTLARDIAMFMPEYKLARLKAVDMFPYTYHLESVALLC